MRFPGSRLDPTPFSSRRESEADSLRSTGTTRPPTGWTADHRPEWRGSRRHQCRARCGRLDLGGREPDPTVRHLPATQVLVYGPSGSRRQVSTDQSGAFTVDQSAGDYTVLLGTLGPNGQKYRYKACDDVLPGPGLHQSCLPRSDLPNTLTLTAGQIQTGVDAELALKAPAFDFSGSGGADPAVFRGGAWLVQGADQVWLGSPGDVAVPADYNGDGVTDRAIFRPSIGAWYIEGEASPHFWGLSSDVPVPADYDGDGDADVAVFRPSVGGWYVEGQGEPCLGSGH